MTLSADGPRNHPEFENLVQALIQELEKDRLNLLRQDFHHRLRMTLTNPENPDLIQDIWDFFYDWVVFEQNLPKELNNLKGSEKSFWEGVKKADQRGLFVVAKISEGFLKLKELFSGNSFTVQTSSENDFLGIGRGDILEGRLTVVKEDPKKPEYVFVRKPSYHPTEVHDYIKKKVKQFKKAKDFSTYQTWLWILVGMSLKYRIYNQMPIDKIYDDNSRI